MKNTLIETFVLSYDLGLSASPPPLARVGKHVPAVKGVKKQRERERGELLSLSKLTGEEGEGPQ